MQTGIVVPSAIQAQYALSLLERWSQHPENDVVKGIPRKSISKLADSFKNIGTLTNDEMRTITNVLIPKIVDNPETIRAAIENDTYFHRAFDDALRATGTPSHGDPAVRLALSLQRTVALTEQSRQATEYKNYVVIPFLEIRLSEMADAGFPVPPHIVNIRESHFAQLPVVVDYERAQTHGFLGKADWRFSQMVLRDTPHDDSFPSDISNLHVVVHESVHHISGISILNDDWMQNKSGVGFIRDGGGIDGGQFRSKHFDVSNALNEAFTESMTRWILSNERPDFGSMTCAEFFQGPLDVPVNIYKKEQQFAANALGDMQMGILSRAFFEDQRFIELESGPTPHWDTFISELNRRIPRGIDGLDDMHKTEITKATDVQQPINGPGKLSGVRKLWGHLSSNQQAPTPGEGFRR